MAIKCELYHDNFQNFKRYNIPKAQLVIADIPYNIGADAYASNPMWYEGGDNRNGESKLAKTSFFHSDGQFRIAEYMHFCNRLLTFSEYTIYCKRSMLITFFHNTQPAGTARWLLLSSGV